MKKIGLRRVRTFHFCVSFKVERLDNTQISNRRVLVVVVAVVVRKGALKKRRGAEMSRAASRGQGNPLKGGLTENAPAFWKLNPIRGRAGKYI